jgi:hypothetical protein
MVSWGDKRNIEVRVIAYRVIIQVSEEVNFVQEEPGQTIYGQFTIPKEALDGEHGKHHLAKALEEEYCALMPELAVLIYRAYLKRNRTRT